MCEPTLPPIAPNSQIELLLLSLDSSYFRDSSVTKSAPILQPMRKRTALTALGF